MPTCHPLCTRSAAIFSGFAAIGLSLCPLRAHGQTPDTNAQIQQLRQVVLQLQRRVDNLEQQLHDKQTAATELSDSGVPVTTAPSIPSSSERLAAPQNTHTLAQSPTTAVSVRQGSLASSIIPVELPGSATLNYTFDGYYEYNFNQPPGRVNDLRAYDVLSNAISINQAALIYDLDPDVSKGRRFGVRLDLQFGQATETLQGNPANEPRPEIYRNIFQAYGTYIVPVGSGLKLDFGKWSSSLGVEGNYTKDQMNYTRSYLFDFLPFYHEGVRASYQFNDKLTANYWVVNGTNQSEPTKSFKDELFGFVLQPTKTVTWTGNYYIGQEHPDSQQASNCAIPVQPGLCVTAVNPVPNGKLHIFDSYLTWQVTPRLSLTGEGDYVLEREWSHASSGKSSDPSHVDGGAAYVQYQLTPRISLATRGEYLSDRGGLFSGSTQALKEITGTYKHSIADGFDAFIELRHDWTNISYFTTHNVGSPSGHQITTTMGLVWWHGGKQGTW